MNQYESMADEEVGRRKSEIEILLRERPAVELAEYMDKALDECYDEESDAIVMILYEVYGELSSKKPYAKTKYIRDKMFEVTGTKAMIDVDPEEVD